MFSSSAFELASKITIGEVLTIGTVLSGAVYIVTRMEVVLKYQRWEIERLQAENAEDRKQFQAAMSAVTESLHAHDRRLTVLEQKAGKEART